MALGARPFQWKSKRVEDDEEEERKKKERMTSIQSNGVHRVAGRGGVWRGVDAGVYPAGLIQGAACIVHHERRRWWRWISRLSDGGGGAGGPRNS